MNRTRGFGVAALLLALLPAACTPLDVALGAIPFFSTMREEPSIDPYQLPRLPAAGSVPMANPRGDVPAPFAQTELAEAGATLTNPLTASPEVLLRGQMLYVRHCFSCHGMQGEGNGPVVGPGKFPFAPAVNSGPAADFSDGYLYAITRVGRGLMPSYGDRIHHLDRWAVVMYLRQLQQQAGGAGAAAAPGAPAGAPAAGTTAPITP
ncbi:MAG: c-type cytochrome [Gemmatimonadetes bacterium]|nr:c-type cytochrome [Gemmatimonadota bacterium]